jgi:hypothetical protein
MVEMVDKRKRELCPFCGQPRHWHTKKWYMTEFQINPERTGIEPKLVPNPHYSTSPKMKLYAECQILQAKADHPELIIKPRTEKQIVVGKRIGELSHDIAYVKRPLRNIAFEEKNFESHLEYHQNPEHGFHNHRDSDFYRMVREIEQDGKIAEKETKERAIEFERKYGRKVI